MNGISPSTLQSFNNELIKSLDNLREQREKNILALRQDQDTEAKLKTDMDKLQKKRNEVAKRIQQKECLETGYKTLIDETEAAYRKIVDSSQTLLEILKQETEKIN
jgi:sjoegren syndrome nuclear autoantigen 1